MFFLAMGIFIMQVRLGAEGGKSLNTSALRPRTLEYATAAAGN